MLRRRLALYAVMLSSGILAGFIILERLRILYGIGFLLSCGILIVYIKEDSLEGKNRDRRILLSVLIAGVLLFTFKYISFNDKNDLPQDSSLSGVVTGVKSGDGCVRYVVRADAPVRAAVLVTVYEDEGAAGAGYDGGRLSVGEKGGFRGRFRKPASQENPHCFDYRMYLLSEGIRYCFISESFESSGFDANPLMKFRSFAYRKRLEYEASFSDEHFRTFISGVIFGDKGGMDEEQINEFNENSTGHILAVSGLHIGFIFALLKRLTRKRRTLGIAVLMISVVFVYGEMTLWSASTVRATLVMSLNILAMFLRKEFDMLSSVSAAAILLLIVNPYQLMNTGFQMSFTAMIGIAMIGPFLSKWVGDEIAVMLAVQIAVAPYSIFVFHRFNPLAILINIPIVFLTSLLVPLCIASLMYLSLLGVVPSVAVTVSEGLSELIIKTNEFLAFDGRFSTDTASPDIRVLVFFYAACLIITSEWTRVRVLRKQYKDVLRLSVGAMIPCIIVATSFCTMDSADVMFVSVGQGDCTHIRTDSVNVLIDGGGRREYPVGEKLLKPYLLANGAAYLDTALVTHLHMDHFKGIEELAGVYPIKQLGVPEICRYGVRGNKGVSFIIRQSIIRLSDDVYIEPIWPVSSKSGDIASDENEMNMVYMVHYRGVRIMVTGDIPGEEELKMVSYYRGTDVLSCDILKVAHHGSSYSTTDEFLDAAKPTYAVISVGEGNMYGHPSADCLERLEKRGIKIFRTDRNGAVGADIGPSGRIKMLVMHE